MFEALPEVATYSIETANVVLAGPPADLPGAVPDLVGGILDSVGAFLDGTLASLGETVSGLAGGGESADAASQASVADAVGQGAD